MTRKTVNPANLALPGMSPGVQAGPLLFTAGQVAMTNDGTLVGEGDCRAQAEQCFRNLAEIIEAAGGTLADVVELTAFLSDAAHARDYLAVRTAMFPDNPPATTTVVAKLLDPRFLIEIKAIALIGK